MLKYKIIDNFLDPGYYESIEENIFNEHAEFPWFYKVCQTHEDSSYFGHVLYHTGKKVSPYYRHFEDIVNILQPNALIGMRLNCVVKRGQDAFVSNPHKDQFSDDMHHTTGILYIGTNDGKTVLVDDETKEETEIDSVANRFLYFDSNTTHYAKQPTSTDRRVVLNINWYANEQWRNFEV